MKQDKTLSNKLGHDHSTIEAVLAYSYKGKTVGLAVVFAQVRELQGHLVNPVELKMIAYTRDFAAMTGDIETYYQVVVLSRS